ncbi:MAG TPA: ferritin-like domain-containing protein [Pyrinomonadaceae bacterium]|nr:ferritin-like domain-containing protein [Pyrinomonadaceae bacterium]
MLTAQEGEQLGQAWLEQALGEHASVAAFARFVLHLISLGAPAELLRESIRAMDDEVRHAITCFDIARRFRGKPAGPGPLDLSQVLNQPNDSASILEAAIVEGCINETIAAQWVYVAASLAEDPVIREALSGIADDESRHADLSWRFVSWLLKADGDSNVPIAKRCFALAMAEPAVTDPADASPQWMEKYGQLSQRTKEEVRERTWNDVILPRMRTLLNLQDDLLFES